MNVNTLINDTDLNVEIAELRDHIKNPNHVVSDIIDDTYTDSRHREIDEASGHPTKYRHSGKNRQRPGNDGLAAPAVCQHGQRHA